MSLAAPLLTGLTGCTEPDDAGGLYPAIRSLQTRLDARPSATAVLQSHCPARIRVIRLPVATLPTADILATLGVSSAQDVVTRHVRLVCGAVVLSDAWNWYVPSRLTDDMNRQLTETDTPFGHVVHEDWFRRQILTSRIPETPTETVLHNRALLHRVSDGLPIALVQEDYTRAALGADHTSG